MKNLEKQARHPVLSCGLKTVAAFAVLVLLIAAGSRIGNAVLFVAGQLESLALSFLDWITVNKTDVLPATLTVWVSLVPVAWLFCLGYTYSTEDSDKGIYLGLAGFGLFCLITAPAGIALMAVPTATFALVHEELLFRLAVLAQFIGAAGLAAWGLAGITLLAILIEAGVSSVFSASERHPKEQLEA